MDQCKIDKINELAQKARTCGLSDDEKALQKELREEYIQAFRNSLTATMDNIYIQQPDGTKIKIKSKECNKEES